MGFMDWFRRKLPDDDAPATIPFPTLREPAITPSCCLEVQVDELGFDAVLRGGDRLRLDFARLTSVIIRTNDQGPWSDDLIWVLTTDDQVFHVPQGVPGEEFLFEAMLKLPGMNRESLISAMACFENVETECWRRQ